MPRDVLVISSVLSAVLGGELNFVVDLIDAFLLAVMRGLGGRRIRLQNPFGRPRHAIGSPALFDPIPVSNVLTAPAIFVSLWSVELSASRREEDAGGEDERADHLSTAFAMWVKPMEIPEIIPHIIDSWAMMMFP